MYIAALAVGLNCPRKIHLNTPWEHAPFQILVDQFTLSQTGGHIMPNTLLLALQIFRPSDFPV